MWFYIKSFSRVFCEIANIGRWLNSKKMHVFLIILFVRSHGTKNCFTIFARWPSRDPKSIDGYHNFWSSVNIVSGCQKRPWPPRDPRSIYLSVTITLAVLLISFRVVRNSHDLRKVRSVDGDYQEIRDLSTVTITLAVLWISFRVARNSPDSRKLRSVDGEHQEIRDQPTVAIAVYVLCPCFQTVRDNTISQLRSPLFDDFLPTLYSAWRSENRRLDPREPDGDRRYAGNIEFDGNVCTTF